MKEFFYKIRFNLEQRKMFYEIMASYLESGVNFTDAVDSMQKRALKDKDYKAYIYKDILKKVGSGVAPSKAIGDWVPANEKMLVEAGEKAGEMAKGFTETVYMSDSISRIKKVVVSNMITPMIMILMLFGMMVGYRLGMVPVFLEFIPLDQWTPNASIVYEVTNFVYEYWYIFIGLILGGSFLIFSTINDFTGPIRKVLDKVPPYNIYKKFVESSFLITFASLLKAKYPIMLALKSMNQDATRYLSYYLVKMMDRIGAGTANEGEALNVGLLNKTLAGILEDTAKLSSFDKAVYNMGTRNIEKSIVEVTAIMKVVNTVLMTLVLLVTLYMFFSVQELSFGIADAMESV